MDFMLTDKQRDLQERAAKAGAAMREAAIEWDRTNSAPYQDVVKHIAEYGLLGLTIPERFGGQGLTALDYLITVEALFRSSQFWICGEPVFATTGPGPSMLLLAENDRTREKFLPDVVRGVRQCAIALTEPDYGSDLTSLETSAIADGDGFIINGDKSFVTGATVNQLYAVFTRFDDIDGHRGVGAVVVEEGTDGLDIDAGPEFLGCRGVPHGTLRLRDVRIPTENVIVGAGKFGKLMTAFNMERLHNCAFNLGMAQAAYDEAVAYTCKRQAFGQELIDFQAVYHGLVDMWTDLEALRLMAQRAASTAIDGNFPKSLETTAAKLFGARIASQITLRSLEMHGGYGATKDYAIERIHRDVVATIVAGGSPPVLRNTLAGELFAPRRFPQRRSTT